MKRGMGGGAHRGPVQPTRQRRTLRFMQILLVLISGALMVLAGYSWGRVDGFEEGRRQASIEAPASPSRAQTVVLVALGGIALGAAALLQDRAGGVRMPTPARLEELAGRAESSAIERAEKVAEESRH